MRDKVNASLSVIEKGDQKDTACFIIIMMIQNEFRKKDES